MKRSVFVLSTESLLGMVSEALAKDVCLTEGPSTLVLRKVKTIKPSGAIALTGFYAIGGAQVSCDGSATMNAAGTSIHLGVFCHGLLFGNNFTWEWTATDATLAGSGDRDTDTDGDFQPGVPLTLTSADCSTLTLP